MASTSLDLSQIKTDALSAASTFRTLIGLGNVNNTSDANKPISSATQSALDGKLSLTGGTLTGGLNGTTGTFSGVIKGSRFNTGPYEDTTAAFSTYHTGGHYFAGASNLYTGQVIWKFRTGPGYILLNDAGNGCSIISESANAFGGEFSVASGAGAIPPQLYNYKFGFRYSDAYLAIPLALGRQGTSATASNTHEGAWLWGEASDTFAQRRSTNAQRFNLYGTYTDASNYRRLYLSSTTAGAFTIGVEGAGTGASGNTLNIGPGITIDRGGFVISVESSLILATTVLQLNSDTGQLRGRNGRIILSDNATGSTFDLLRFGGITNSFPAIKRNGTALNFRLADDSADAPITASNGTFSGAISAVTKSFLIDHPTKPGRKLQYGSLESPYHGIRLTGRSFVDGGIGVIELPDYVRAFVSDDVNIQLTPVGRNILWVDCIDLNNNQVIVGADSDGDFYWSFTGIRTDVELEVEPWA